MTSLPTTHLQKFVQHTTKGEPVGRRVVCDPLGEHLRSHVPMRSAKIHLAWLGDRRRTAKNVLLTRWRAASSSKNRRLNRGRTLEPENKQNTSSKRFFKGTDVEQFQGTEFQKANALLGHGKGDY